MTSALVRCVDCDQPVSRRAEACPSCGRVLRQRPGSTTLAFVDVAVILVLCVVLLPLALGLLGLAVAEIPRALRMLGGLW
jgi:uncharacterized paraquat-inducible protein A